VPPSPNRWILLLAAAVVALVLPGHATAHSRGKAVAVDYVLVLDHVPQGIHAEPVEGDFAVSLRVGDAQRVVIRRAFGPPIVLERGQVFVWHDDRLATRSRIVLPLTVDGRRDGLTGTLLRVSPPSLWPWLLGGVVAAGVLVRLRSVGAAALVAVLGALAAAASFGAWVETGLAAALLVVAVLAFRRPVLGGVAGAVAVAVALAWLGAFRHGVVVSSLPDWLARLATGSAFVAGAVAVVLGVLEPRTEQVRAMRRDVRADL
jgi:hypothetical protein